MNFGTAIELLKKDVRVTRVGWNGRNMYLFVRRGSVALGPRDNGEPINGVPLSLFQQNRSPFAPAEMPCVCMRAADGSIVVGWLASQTDMFAEDWIGLADEGANGCSVSAIQDSSIGN